MERADPSQNAGVNLPVIRRWVMDIVLGILGVVFGLALTFMGLQVFFISLPILGFITGFFVGTIGVTELFGDGFLSTATGIIAGIAIGIVFALLSYLWWYAGALIAAGALGALGGSGLAELFGIDSDWVVFTFSAVGAVVFFVAALLLNLPTYIVIVSTAFAGATTLIAGALLIFNQIDNEELGRGTATAIIGDSFWWTLVWIVVGSLGLIVQLAVRTVIALPEERWTTAYPPPTATA
jgi:hypothetical protein